MAAHELIYLQAQICVFTLSSQRQEVACCDLNQAKGREGKGKLVWQNKAFLHLTSCWMDLKQKISTTIQGIYPKSISISGTTYDKLGNCIQFGDPLDLAIGYLGSISENTDAF